MEATIISNKRVAFKVFEMQLQAHDKIENVKAGQFLHIKIPNAGEKILRRPISINFFDEKKDVFTIVYQINGKGTECLSRLERDEVVDFTGPLGNGFTIPESAKRVFLVGGGVGVAPLRYLASVSPQCELEAFLGFRSADVSYQVQEFETLCKNVRIATEDGSLGSKGFITDLLSIEIEKNGAPDFICACGPTPMLKSLQQAAEGIPGLISLEERMGCGVGACRACVCRVKSKNGEGLKRVCCDGPVFQMDEVEL